MLWLRLGIRLLFALILILALRYAVPPLLSLFMPFVLALVVAWFLNPPVKALQKRLGLSRGFLSFLLLALLFTAAGGLFFVLGRSLFLEISSLVNNYQSIWSYLQGVIQEVGAAFDRLWALLPSEVEDLSQELLARISQWVNTALPELLSGFAGRAGSVALGIPSFTVALIVFLMGSYFITADYPRLRFLVTDHMPKSARGFFSHIKHTALGAFGGYIRAEVIISVGVFFILLVGFLLLGQSYAVLLALVLAVVDFIPIVGSGTLMVPWAVVDLITGNWPHAVGLMVVWGVVCVFRRVAEPKAVGSQTGLSPILSLVSMYVGMRLGGVLGMILGPILCLVAINLCRTGIFDGLAADLTLMASDLASILRDRPPRAPLE